MTALIKPQALLWRLRPLQMAVAVRQLRHAARLARALEMLRTFFPERLEAEFERGFAHCSDWHLPLGVFYRQVEEQGWFPVNWELLDEAWAHWMQQEDDHGDHLAVWLSHIPVQMFGFSDGERIFEYPPLELLRALLDENVEAVSSELLIESELYDTLNEWHPSDRRRAWQKLDRIDRDPGRHPPGARFLPALARWACGRTGNVLLDRHFDPYNHGPWFPWAEREPLCRLWRRAAPSVAALERLMAWYQTDQTRLTLLTNFLINGGSTDEFDW